MGYECQIHNFLYGCGCQKAETGRAGRHHVLMIAENVQSVSGNGTRGHVKGAGQKLAGNLVHAGNHQQQALRSRKG